jgi:hypothetical protein
LTELVGVEVAEPGGLAAVATLFNLAPEEAADYFAEHDGDLRIEIETARLGRPERAIALLLIVSRGIEELPLGNQSGFSFA